MLKILNPQLRAINIFDINFYSFIFLCYFIILNNKGLNFFFKFFFKNIKKSNYNQTKLFFFKKNYFFKNNYYKRNIINRENKLITFNTKNKLFKLHKFFINKFNVINSTVLFSFNKLVIKKILKNTLPLKTLNEDLFFNKTYLYRYNMFLPKFSNTTLILHTYSFKFKKFKKFKKTVFSFLKKQRILTKYKKKIKKIFLFFFYTDFFFFNPYYGITKYIKRRAYFLRKSKKIFFFKHKYRFRRFKLKKLLVSTRFITSKFLIKKKIHLLQFIFKRYIKDCLFFSNIFKDFFFKLFKKNLYKLRKLLNKKKNKYFYSSRKFFYIKRQKKDFFKKSIYFFKFLTIFKKINFFKYTVLKDKFFFKYKPQVFSLYRRTFLTSKIISFYTLTEYYRSWKYKYKALDNVEGCANLINIKKNKNLRKRIMFLDFNQSILKKLRETRKIHWKLKNSGVLNKRRYINFLDKSVKFTSKQNNYLIYLFLQIFIKIVSWHHITLIKGYHLFLVNGNILHNTPLSGGDLVESCLSKKQQILFSWFLINDKKYTNVVKKWAYINYCRFSNSSLKKRKKLPKVLNKLTLNNKHITKLWFIDYSLGCAVFFKKKITVSISTSVDKYRSSILKLHNWRYVP